MAQWMLVRNGLLHCGSAHATLVVPTASATASMPSAIIASRNRSMGVSVHSLRRFSTIPDRRKRNHFKSNRDHKDANAVDDKPKVGSWNLFDSAAGQGKGTGANANGSKAKTGAGGGADSAGPKGNDRQGPKKVYGRRAGGLAGKDGNGGNGDKFAFTNKFQNLLSFAFDGDDDNKNSTKDSSSAPPTMTLPTRGGLKGKKSPLGLSTQNRKPAFGGFQNRLDLDGANETTTDLATDDDEDSATTAAHSEDSDATRMKKPKPTAEEVAKKKQLKHKTKKDGRSLLKNFKFENSIFGSDSDLFGHVDWDERGTVNREERRFKRQQRKADKRPEKVVLPPQEVEIPTRISVKDLADRMGVKSKILIRALRDLGERGVNDTSILTNDIAEVAVEELNMIPVLLPPDFVDVELTPLPADCSMFAVRPPVISVMGHVDHGKTTLLDTLRKANVAASEAGGITQSIGAFSVDLGDKFGKMGAITFIDTPGHAAFSNMRSMGSEVTDIIVLVVAADDGVRPQTREVIRLAHKNQVPLVIAVTKMDMHSHDQEEVTKRIADELLHHGVVTESMGGDTPLVCVSGKTGEGLDMLKETIALHAEVLDLRANVDAGGEAVVLESKMARGVGAQVDTIVKWGTLEVGSIVVSGLEYGKIRGLVSADGKRIKQATPGTPVRVIGLKGLPNSGEALLTVPTEERAKEVVRNREELLQWDEMAAAEEAAVEAAGGEDAFPSRRRYMGGRAKSRELEFRRRQAVDEAARVAALKVGDEGYVAKVVPIIVKTDSVGVISAIDDLIAALPTDEVVIKRVLGAVGAVSSSDLALAEAIGATVYHFNVKHPAGIDQEALQKDVTLKAHNVIYSLLDDITDLLRDNLTGVEEVTVSGSAEIVQAIPINKSGRKMVNIAGCRVTFGALNMQAKYRLMRDGQVVIDDLNMDTMRHFQEKVSEVTKGQECGLQLSNYDTFEPGDVLEAYTVKIVKKVV